jgi:hypothetical protein
MRVDGESPGLAFDDMQHRAIKGTNDWRKYDVVLEIPNKGNAIFFGILLSGTKGRVWIDDVRFEVVGNDVPTTGTALEERRRPGVENIPRRPGNLDFEQ